MFDNLNFFKVSLVVFFSLKTSILLSQEGSSLLPTDATLDDCLKYAFKNQPVIIQANLEEEISRQNVKIALSDWYPQLSAAANVEHYLKLQESYFPNLSNPSGPKNLVTTGVFNTSAIQFSASQVLFNNDVFLAAKTAKSYQKQASENTQNIKINLVVNVSKAFYDVMLTQQQLSLIVEEIARLERNLKDTYNQYKNGISDKIDYKRATMSLESARADKLSAEENLKAKYAFLKQLMGYPADKKLIISYDNTNIPQDILADTTIVLHYSNRIEYQMLQTQLILQKANISFYKIGFLPSLSAFADYNVVYQNDKFSNLYNADFPNSYLGLSLSLPIFQGNKRLHNLKKAHLQYEELSLDSITLKNQFNTEYIQALSSYKSNLNEFKIDLENIKIAQEVYDLVKFQYGQGIKTYLEVIVSETDLLTSQINELNALIKVLSAKLDLEKALGNISTNY